MSQWAETRLGSSGESAGRGREAMMKEAEALRGQGAIADARATCQAILREWPDEARALALMAELAADARQVDDGLQWVARAILADPGNGDSHYAAGRLHEIAGRLAEAEESYRAAIRLSPGNAKAHNNLGGVLHMQGRLDEALANYRKALELDPRQPEANQNYASIVRDGDALEEAVKGYLRRTRAVPHDAEAHNNLANCYRELGQHREALASFERAIAADPEHAEAHFGRSLVMLLCGDYENGWREYEWRLRIPALNASVRRFPQAAWDGRVIEGGTILLHAEQGIGDTLQFARYAPQVAQRCASVVFECQPELKSLMASVAGIRQVVAQGEPLPPFTTHAPLMSLPWIFGTTLASVPWHGPYIHADPGRSAAWRARVGLGAGRLNVGLAWAGRPQYWDDRKRSITLDQLAPLAQVFGAVFYSVQKGEAAAQAASPPAGMNLVDLTADIEDFSDTAALLGQLDLMIAVDTSVGHLAGAMGLPTWLLLPFAPDWRHQLERSDNPWYPSMQLFRQERDGGWAGPIARVAAALAAKCRTA